MSTMSYSVDRRTMAVQVLDPAGESHPAGWEQNFVVHITRSADGTVTAELPEIATMELAPDTTDTLALRLAIAVLRELVDAGEA